MSGPAGCRPCRGYDPRRAARTRPPRRCPASRPRRSVGPTCREGGISLGYFILPYRILFHDTMSYGTHHFLANFRFQCQAREELLFGHVLADPAARASCDDLLFLTREGYCRNLAPVG